MLFSLLSTFIYILFAYIIFNELFLRFSVYRTPPNHPYKYASWFRNIKYLVSLALVSVQHRRNRRRHIEDEANLIKRLEKPQRLEQFGQQANDAIAFAGSDNRGNQILLRYGRRLNGVAEFWLLLKIVDGDGRGQVYVHPEHPNGIFTNAQQNAFAAGGLKFEIIEPMKKWRITYNGWMRKDEGQKSEEKRSADGLQRTAFQFEWTAVSNPFHFHHELDPGLIASAMAEQCWSRTFFQQLKDHSARGHEARYEQWGRLEGSVTIGEDGPVQMKVTAMRDHNSGPRDWHQYNRYIANMGITEDGHYFHIGAVSMKHGLKHLLYGYIGDASGHLYPVQSCSIDLARLGDDRIPPDDFTFSFTANSKRYFITIHVEDRITVFNGIGWPSHSNLQFIKIELNGNIGYGFSEFEYRNLKENAGDKNALRDAAVFPETMGMESLSNEERRVAVFPLGHRAGLCEDLVGARTVLISQLWRQQGKFSVPGGVVITSSAFQIDSQVWRECGKTTSSDKQSDTNRRHVIIAKLQEIYEDIQQAHTNPTGDRPVTILFSGPGSAQNERVNATNREQFLRAILSSTGATEIHSSTGSSGYSFIVQESIEGELSGAVWTCDPITKHPALVIVTLKKDGQVKEYVIDRTYDNHLKLKSKAGANEAKVISIAELGLHLETAFRSPRYIEFVEKNGIIYVLEVRLEYSK